jgi:prevent-host-death family protein
MTSVALSEVRTPLSEFLDEVAKGKTILVTRRGKPAAVLSPPPPEKRKDTAKVIAEFKSYSREQRRTLGNFTYRELIKEGRRF